MINWNEVTVGETDLVDPNGIIWRVVCIDGDWVWLRHENQARDHITRIKQFLTDWTIYDPYEEVTEACHISQYGAIMHGEQIISTHQLISGQYKKSEKGLRVWKRKEG